MQNRIDFKDSTAPSQTHPIGRRKLLYGLLFAVGYVSTRILCEPAAPASSGLLAQSAQEPDVETQKIGYPAPDGNISATLMKPKGADNLPAILMVHADRGLNDRLLSYARRLAAGGFMVLAPDLLSRAGGSSKFTFVQAGQETARLDPDSTVSDVDAGYAFLAKSPDVDPQNISAVGFGWGVWRVFMLAEKEPRLRRAVVFFGTTPVDGLEKIHTPFFEHYAQLDFRVTGNAVWTEKMLGKNFTYYVYPKTDQQFLYEGTPGYNAEAADLAWKKTFAFLRS